MTAILNDGRDNDVIRSMIEKCDFGSIVKDLLEQLENVVPTNPPQIAFNGKVFEMISALLGLSE